MSSHRGAHPQHGYDLPYHWCMGEFFRYVVSEAVRRVAPLVRDRRVLDVGCGDGFTSALLANEASALYGFDPSEKAVAFANLIVERPNVRFSVGRAEDVRRIAESLGPIDVVAAFEVIEHLDARERDSFLAGALPVLAPSRGTLILTTPNRGRAAHGNPFHFHEYSPEEMRALLESAGFSDVEVQGLYLYPPAASHLEHFADTVPFRALFRLLGGAGKGYPSLCRTLVCTATAR